MYVVLFAVYSSTVALLLYLFVLIAHIVLGFAFSPGFMIKCYMNYDMGFPTMWDVRQAKPQTSLSIRAV